MPQTNTARAASDEPQEQHESQRGRPPVDRFHKGQVHASIFRNESARGDFHTATIDLRYKDKNDPDPQSGWKSGRSYSTSALRDLEDVAKMAREKIEALDKGKEKSSPQR